MSYITKEINSGEYKQSINGGIAYELIGPSNIILQVNYDCLLKCLMCDRHTWVRNYAPKDKVLTDTELNNLFQNLAILGTRRVTLVGTEPVLRSDIKEILTGIKTVGIKPELYTAGVLFKDDVITSVLDNGVDVSFSVDGFNSISHDNIRYPNGKLDAFRKTIASIQKLAKERDKRDYTKNDTRITANMTLQKGNIKDLETVTPDQIESLSVDTLRISVAHGKGSYILDREDIPTIVDFTKKIDSFRIKSRILLSPVMNYLRIGQIEPSDFDQNILIPSEIMTGKTRVRCHIGEYSATIDPQGNVYPCLYLYNDNGTYQDNYRKRFIVGNVRTQKFSEIWAGDDFNKFRKATYPDLSLESRCRTCEYIEQFKEIDDKLSDPRLGTIKIGW